MAELFYEWMNGNWDYLWFAVVMGIVPIVLIRLMYARWASLRNSRNMRTVSVFLTVATAGGICCGWFLVQNSEQWEYERTKEIMIIGAPILAYELSRLGHEKIVLSTQLDDPQYLGMIGTMKDWMRLNDQLQSVYTVRKLEDGRNAFILAPETDYDRNGIIEGDMESSDPIGLIYDEYIPELEEAFNGRLTFQAEVTEDHWGKTISAYVPILDANGQQEAVLGLDYDGKMFMKSVAMSRLWMIGLLAFIFLMMDAIFAIGVYYAMERQFRRHQEELHRQAEQDLLTGLPNRAVFCTRLTQSLTVQPNHAYTTAVMFLDLDRFKNVNDSLGHIVGDQILRQLADRLTAGLDEGDFLARPGGDEYMILIGKARNLDDVLNKAEAILSSFEEPVRVGDYELYLTTSIGVSHYPTGGRDADTMIRNADTAMYFAKERGSRLHVYTEDMNVKLLERLSIENDLRKGIERNEFVLFYQPKVDVRSGKVMGMEALIRWNHPDKGMISPGKFIPVAEDTGLILPLGEWVLAEACRQLKSWESKGFHPLPVSVNLSSRQFQNKDLMVRIRNILSEYQINPGLLELELTESCMMQTPELSNHTMYQLKKFGLKLAVDDFGTGYSSLSYLRSFPLDVLKIDRGFVNDVTVNPDHAAIVTTIISLAHNLGLKVVCEGVETKEQLEFLKARNCDIIQGYYYSRPVPPEEFETWMEQARFNSGNQRA